MNRAALILVFIAGVTVLSAQAPTIGPPAPAFEVASVRRNVLGEPRAGGPTALGRIMPSGISYTNYTLPMLIQTAYRFALDRVPVLIVEHVEPPMEN